LEVFVGGVDAYSTLGWFKDPLLNTFLFQPDPCLADLLFHELAHQQLFASGDTDFNESFATFVGQEGTRQWLLRKGSQKTIDAYQAYLRRNEQFERLALATRDQLETLYGDRRDKAGNIHSAGHKTDQEARALRREKARILLEMENRFATLKASWDGPSAYDGWFSHPLNNAQLNSLANYYAFVPGFQKLFAEQAGDWSNFYKEAKRLSHLPKKERHASLQILRAGHSCQPDHTTAGMLAE
jgi:predicted aminopeptidase